LCEKVSFFQKFLGVVGGFFQKAPYTSPLPDKSKFKKEKRQKTLPFVSFEIY
jgi:hypothetical protein